MPAVKLLFIEPMYATALRELPAEATWADEAKLDGYRCLAGGRKALRFGRVDEICSVAKGE